MTAARNRRRSRRSRRAVAALMARYEPMVARLARDLCRMWPLDVDDVGSVVRLQVLRCARSWDPTRGTFMTYAWRSGWGAGLSFCVKEAARGLTGGSGRRGGSPRLVSLDFSPDAGDDTRGRRVRLEGLLRDPKAADPSAVSEWDSLTADLSPRERLLLDLRFRGGLHLREIGGQFDRKESWAKRHVDAALEKVRRQIESHPAYRPEPAGPRA